jgi:hypothetical protein
MNPKLFEAHQFQRRMVHLVLVLQFEESKLAKRRHLLLRYVQKDRNPVRLVNNGGFTERELLDVGISLLRAVAWCAVRNNGGRKNLLGDKAGLTSEIDFNDSLAGDVKAQ